MDHRKRFHEILAFLKPYQTIWQNEIMLMYPSPFDGYPMEWIEELASFKDKEVIMRLEKKDVLEFVRSPSLIDFYRRVEELSALPKAPELPPMPEGPFTFLYMIPKKQYEIRKLAPAINDFYHQNAIKKIVDIGGGIGLLAQTLTNQYNLKVHSLDFDPALQETGKTRHRKNFKHQDNLVTYHLVKVKADEPSFLNLLDEQTLTVGLHTCGTLANDQIIASASRQTKGILSLGCCYHKLEKFPGSQNISQFAQSNGGLEFSRFALTLSSRAHRKMDEKDFDLKQKVKLYRYAFHFLLHDEYDQKEMVTLGNSSPKLYDESFGAYALEQFSRLNWQPKHTLNELNDWYAREELHQLIWKMLAASLIRNAFGRVLELYILLDRAIYLEEHGYHVDLLEFFDEETSPRNIGLLGKSLP